MNKHTTIQALEELLCALMWTPPRLKRELIDGLARDQDITVAEASRQFNQMKTTLRRMIKGLKRQVALKPLLTRARTRPNL